MDNETKKLLYRLKNTADGKDFIDYILSLSNDNYKSWKMEGGDVLRGKAIMLDQLLENFEKCDEHLVIKKEPAEWL